MTLKFYKQRYCNMIMRFALLSLVFLTTLVQAQVKTYPVAQNAQLTKFVADHPDYVWGENDKMKWGQKDTLELPFFDDFSTSSIYPDSSKWLQNYTYVNNHFPINPPTFNVATFDVLDSDGRPYNAINKDFTSYGDSLMSQAINLKDSSGIPYTLADSIMFSFFYQPNGYGYHLNGEDSLRLFFKSSNNTWTKVWSVGGQPLSEDFKHVTIVVEDTSFLHQGFQILFTTVTRQVANANHWHIDYINLAADKKKSVDYYDDYAIQTTASPILKNYYEMPYDHYLVNTAAETPDSIFFRVSNLFNVTKAIRVNHTEVYGGTTLVNTSFPINTANVPAKGGSDRRVKIYDFTTITAPPIFNIERTFRVNQSGALNAVTSNDSMVIKQKFSDYYAYDDGSAEQGFGFDQDINPKNIEGQIAYRFNLKKADTLYAIATFFNEAVFDVSSSRFKYRVWQEIAGINGGATNNIIYESSEQVPNYQSKGGHRNYTYHYLDSALVLPAGDFYIGWTQASIYNLNVGWDKNFGNRRNPNQASTNLYYNLFDTWGNSDLPEGTLMMRPHFGTTRDIIASVNKPKYQIDDFNLFPNPASGFFQLDKEYQNVIVHDALGSKVIDMQMTQKVDVSNLVDGMYFVIVTNEKGQSYRTKLTIFAQ